MKKKYFKPQMNTIDIPKFCLLAASDSNSMDVFGDGEIEEDDII